MVIFGDWKFVIDKGVFCIRKVYVVIRERYEKVFWKNIVCDNDVVFRFFFIVWIALLGKFRIKDILVGCMEIDIICVFWRIYVEIMMYILFDLNILLLFWGVILIWLGYSRGI